MSGAARDEAMEESPLYRDQSDVKILGQAISQEQIQRRKQLEILEFFGTIDFDPTHDYKRSRQLDEIPIDDSEASK